MTAGGLCLGLVDAGHTLAKPWILAGQFVQRHPESACFSHLVDEGLRIKLFPAMRTGGKHGHCMAGRCLVGTTRRTVLVTGIFLRPPIGTAQQGKKERRTDPPLTGNVLAGNVPKLMADIEIDPLRIIFQSIDNVGKKNHVVTTKEARCKCVQNTVTGHQIGFRQLGNAGRCCARLDTFMQLGKLFGSNFYGIPLQMGNQCRMTNKHEKIDEDHVNPEDPQCTQSQEQPENDCHESRNTEQRLFVTIRTKPCFDALRLF